MMNAALKIPFFVMLRLISFAGWGYSFSVSTGIYSILALPAAGSGLHDSLTKNFNVEAVGTIHHLVDVFSFLEVIIFVAWMDRHLARSGLARSGPHRSISFSGGHRMPPVSAQS